MTNITDTVTASFERAANAAKTSEDAFRKQAAAEIGRLEAERLKAFRRVRLINMLESAAAAAESEQVMIETQRRRLCQEFGWSEDNEAQREVLQKLDGVCRVVQPTAANAARRDAALSELKAFEDWFEASRKVSFYALFDRYVQETPVVDF